MHTERLREIVRLHDAPGPLEGGEPAIEPGAQNPAARQRPWSRLIKVVVLLAPLAAVLAALIETDASDVGAFGLASALPWFGVVGVLAMVIVAASATFLDPFDERFAGASVLSFVLAISAAPAIVYDTARFSWAFKHVGIVDYVNRTGGIDSSIDLLGVYHNWPGFFVAAATLTNWFDLDDAIVIAEWAPVPLNMLTLAGVVFLLGSLSDARRTVWLGALLFFLTNWIGQDYFSPQALAFILYLNVIALVLRFYGNDREQRPPPVLHVITGLLMFIIAASHQLTPLVLLAALGGLLLVRRCRQALVPLLGGWIVLLWATTWAESYVSANLRDQFDRVGSPLANAGETLAKAVERSPAQVWVATAGRGLFLLVLFLGLVGLALRLWRRQDVAAPGVLLMAPAAMLVMQFGGEILFRVALFMLPVLSLLAAEVLRSVPRPGLQRLSVIGATLVCVPLLGLASFGKDAFYSFSANELETAGELMRLAPDNSLLIEGSRNYPSQLLEYEKFTYVAISREPVATQLRIQADPGDELLRWMTQDDYAASYAIFTQSQHLEAEALGSLPNGFLPEVIAELRADDRFAILIDGPDAVVFVAADQ